MQSRGKLASVTRFQCCGGIYSCSNTLDLGIHGTKSTSDQNEMWSRYKRSAKRELTVYTLSIAYQKQLDMRSGPRNTEAPLRERSNSSRADKSPRNVRLIIVEENYSNRSRHSHAAVITCHLGLAPERRGLARCPSRFGVLLA